MSGGVYKFDRDAFVAEAEAVPAELTEDALAQRFTERHGEGLRYVEKWGRWLTWNGAAWRFDQTRWPWDLARAVCREAAGETDKEGLKRRIASAQTVAAVIRLAEADPKHARTSDAWDVEPLLLNTPGGTVDLRTGSLRRHDRENALTKLSAATLSEDRCPLWLAFLARATGEDSDLEAFLQRMAGYALTGETREHALFFLWGTGGNGKSVFLNTLTGILGDYATVASMETFTATHGERHPTDIAMLRGARLVAAQETEEGRRWAESRLKALTGGDPVQGRFMRQDFFTFVPQFKLVIAGNHKPRLRNVDEAMRRRLHLVPFTQTIPLAERDPLLPEKLKAEWPAILGWAVRGCMVWQQEGLRAPASVQAATDSYFEAEDAFARWLEDRCIRERGLVARGADLFASWKAWAEQAGEFSSSQRWLTERLAGVGFESVRNVAGCRGRGFRGLALRPQTEE